MALRMEKGFGRTSFWVERVCGTMRGQGRILPGMYGVMVTLTRLWGQGQKWLCSGFPATLGFCPYPAFVN